MNDTMSKATQVEKMLDEEETAPAAPQISEVSPIPAALREAITWARQNGVSEMELPNVGRFVLRPAAPPSLPTKADLEAKFPKVKLAPGGYDESILYASSPNPTITPGSPFVPDSDEPLPPPDEE